ncbi:hypothetical protein SAMN02910276_00301 [Butyrivibrio sp. Su6]|uniref:hypothetical protein n=1 Tax=Butyrivibrio sp. Su6 TaxID=1520810 RepID=UPI00089F3164|nr:hypothetical protein [Butyrivibrio sp. Su6]SEF46797.1 hypothetical protein SAMN02910276_00301 [Butyrivibrio sp. Su6]
MKIEEAEKIINSSSNMDEAMKKLNISKVKLTDEQLDMIAGGVDWTKVVLKIFKEVVKNNPAK